MNVNRVTNIYSPHSFSFSGRKDVMKKSDKFADEVILLANRRKLTTEEIHKLIHSYIPEVQIATQRPKKSRGVSQVGEYLANYTFTNSTRKFELGDKLLRLTPLSRGSFSKVDCIGNLTHEMTHAFQSEDIDCSIKNTFNKYLSRLPKAEIEKNVSFGFDFWFYFEDTIFNDFITFYHKSSSVNKDRLPFSVDVEPISMKKCVEDKLKHAKRVYPNFNEEFLKEFIKFNLHAEADAYEAEARAIRKYKHEPMRREDMLLPNLYRQVANCIE